MNTQRTFLRSAKFFGLMATIIICLGSCKKPPVIPPNPNPKPTSTFKNVWINGQCNVNFTPGTVNKISNSSSSVYSYTWGNTLMLNGYGTVSLEISDLDTLFANGASVVDGSSITLLKDLVVACNGNDSLLLNINAKDSINVYVNGMGNYNFTGTTPKLNLVSNGAGVFQGYNLISQDANVFVNGDGNSEIYVTGTLNVWMNGNGNVYYKGNPTTVNPVFKNGSGQLIKK